MAVTSKCKFPHDLNFAIKLLEDEIGARLLANQQLLKAAEDAMYGILGTGGAGTLGSALDQGNAILDELLANNGAGTPTSSGITSGADVAKQYGLLPDNATDEDQEKFLANAGINLVDGVVYMSGDTSTNPTDIYNIENLRRLYFAVGKDLAKTEELISTSTKTIIVHDKLDLKILPPKKGRGPYDLYSLKELQEQFGNQITEDDFEYTADHRTVVLLTSFLAIDKMKTETMHDSGVSSDQFISNIFHLNGVDSSPSAVSRYMNMQYVGQELSAILAGDDRINIDFLNLISYTEELQADVGRIIPKIDRLEQIFANHPENKNYDWFWTALDFYEVQQEVTKSVKKHEGLISATLFKVSTELQPDIITKLRSKHTDDKIKYMLESRPDILGIYFEPPDDLLMGHIAEKTSAALPGTTYISNQAVNKKTPSKMDKKVLLKMYCDLLDAETYLETRTKNALSSARDSLWHYMGLKPLYTIDYRNKEIIQGQPSAASPSSILTPKLDVGKTMDIEKRKENVYGTFKDLNDMYGKDISEPLTEIIMSIVKLFDMVFKAIDRLIEQAEKTLFALKNKLDAWLSKHLSLIGGGDFNSSLLKCAINWDISLSTDVLDRLFAFVMQIIGKVIEIISKLKSWISDILTKLLCYPVNILNSLIGKVSVALPSACRLPKFDLPDNMTVALNALMNCSTVKGIVLQSFSKDLAKLKMSVSAAPDRLGQFRNSALCESSATSNFMNAATLNVGIGI